VFAILASPIMRLSRLGYTGELGLRRPRRPSSRQSCVSLRDWLRCFLASTPLRKSQGLLLGFSRRPYRLAIACRSVRQPSRQFSSRGFAAARVGTICARCRAPRAPVIGNGCRISPPASAAAVAYTFADFATSYRARGLGPPPSRTWCSRLDPGPISVVQSPESVWRDAASAYLPEPPLRCCSPGWCLASQSISGRLRRGRAGGARDTWSPSGCCCGPLRRRANN